MILEPSSSSRFIYFFHLISPVCVVLCRKFITSVFLNVCNQLLTVTSHTFTWKKYMCRQVVAFVSDYHSYFCNSTTLFHILMLDKETEPHFCLTFNTLIPKHLNWLWTVSSTSQYLVQYWLGNAVLDRSSHKIVQLPYLPQFWSFDPINCHMEGP